MSGLLALLAALFGFASCAPGASESSSIATGSAPVMCGPGDSLRGDVDGDGKQDIVNHHYGDDAVVTVCFGRGGTATADGLGQAEGLLVFDVDSDGADEVLPGATTSSEAGYDVLRWDGDELVRIGITLSSGGFVAGHEGKARYAFGCEPPNRLVQVDVDWAARSVTVSTHTVDGGRVSTSRRTSKLPGDAGDDYAGSLVKPCAAMGPR